MEDAIESSGDVCRDGPVVMASHNSNATLRRLNSNRSSFGVIEDVEMAHEEVGAYPRCACPSILLLISPSCTRAPSRRVYQRACLPFRIAELGPTQE